MGFFIQVNDKGGKHFRKYTKDTLQMLFDVSPTSANFELMILVEGLVFLAYRKHCILNKCEADYEAFVKDKNKSTFSKAIETILSLKIIDEELSVKLNDYRVSRNEIAHDLFRIKSTGLMLNEKFDFKNYTYTEALRNLFNKGVEVVEILSEILIPGKDESDDFVIRPKTERLVIKPERNHI